MSYYIRFRIRGKEDSLFVAEWLNDRGLTSDDVMYHSGGWEDYCKESVDPHFKFENESDAIVFALAMESRCESTIPIHVGTGIGGNITISCGPTLPPPVKVGI